MDERKKEMGGIEMKSESEKQTEQQSADQKPCDLKQDEIYSPTASNISTSSLHLRRSRG
jgi:hypothetical protein